MHAFRGSKVSKKDILYKQPLKPNCFKKVLISFHKPISYPGFLKVTWVFSGALAFSGRLGVSWEVRGFLGIFLRGFPGGCPGGSLGV